MERRRTPPWSYTVPMGTHRKLACDLIKSWKLISENWTTSTLTHTAMAPTDTQTDRQMDIAPHGPNRTRSPKGQKKGGMAIWTKAVREAL